MKFMLEMVSVPEDFIMAWYVAAEDTSFYLDEGSRLLQFPVQVHDGDAVVWVINTCPVSRSPSKINIKCTVCCAER